MMQDNSVATTERPSLFLQTNQNKSNSGSEPNITHIFIGFTPLHARTTESILCDVRGEKFCFFTKLWPDSKLDYKAIGFQLPNKGLLRSALYVFSLMFFSIKIRRIIRTRESIAIHIPHPLGPAANFLFFHPLISNINIYEDGILNYYDALVGDQKLKLGQRLLSCICFLPYTKYTGHLSGCDARPIEAAYLSRPSHAVRKHKFRKIITLNNFRKSTAPDPKKILFLDQNTSTHLQGIARDKLIEQMFVLFPRKDYEYHYKPHHDYVSRTAMAALPESIRYLAAEDVVSKINPGIVISFFSSALINIKQENPSIRCISLAGGAVKVKIDGKDEGLDVIFNSANVECKSIKNV